MYQFLSICTYFLKVFCVIQDYHIEYGRDIEIEKDKEGYIKSITIKFWHLGALNFHLKEITNGNIDLDFIFNKTWKQTGCKAKVTVSNDKPCVLCYKRSTELFTIQLSYDLFNKYGTVCSF